MEKVKDKIMYQATTRDYKIGDVIEFGKQRNYQAVRVYEKQFKMPNGMSAYEFVRDKLKNNQTLTYNEMAVLAECIADYEFCLREMGIEHCRKLHYKNYPSRLKGMFLTDTIEGAKMFLTTAQCKGKSTDPKVVAVKLNGILHKTSNDFNGRGGRSFDEFVKQANRYWQGVDESFNDRSTEYVFEGTAEIVDIIK